MTALFKVPEAPAVDDCLPELTGSEAQVRWARHERRELLADVDRLIGQMQALAAAYDAAGRDDLAERQREELQRTVAAAGRVTTRRSACWWIDRRKNTALELLTDAPARPGNSLVRRGEE